jgi:hypothetical protein
MRVLRFIAYAACRTLTWWACAVGFIGAVLGFVYALATWPAMTFSICAAGFVLIGGAAKLSEFYDAFAIRERCTPRSDA